MTQLFHLDPANIDPIAIETAAVALREGKTVAFPTETVYGLGANALDPQAVKRIFEAKDRPADNPLIVHIASTNELHAIVSTIPPVAEQLMRHFWPGPLTIVLPRAASIPDEVTAGLETVAVRMPDHPVALALIAACGLPVAAPSANRSGRPSPTRAEHVVEDLWGKVEVILDAGSCSVGVESTVLDLTCDPPMILRPGGVTKEMLEEVLGAPIAVDPAIEREPLAPRPSPLVEGGGWQPSHQATKSPCGTGECRDAAQPNQCRGAAQPRPPVRGSEETGDDSCQPPNPEFREALGFGLWPLDSTSAFAPRSPGMKYTHYAPQAPMKLYIGARDAVVRAIAERAAAETDAGHKVGVMLTSPVAFMPGEIVIALGEDRGESPSHQATKPPCGTGDCRGEAGAAEQRPYTRPGCPTSLPTLGTRDSFALPCACWLHTNPHLDWLKENNANEHDVYSPAALQAIANGIYDALRRFDEAGVDIILAQGVPEVGLGQAIMNRLSKAAGGHVIRVGDE